MAVFFVILFIVYNLPRNWWIETFRFLKNSSSFKFVENFVSLFQTLDSFGALVYVICNNLAGPMSIGLSLYMSLIFILKLTHVLGVFFLHHMQAAYK